MSISSSAKDRIISLYKSGKPFTKISRMTGIDRKEISKLLEQWGVKQPGVIKYLPIDEVISLYKSGETAANIGKRFGVSDGTILARLKENGIERRSQRYKLPIKKIITLYQTGKSTNKIADIFGVDTGVISRRLKEQGIEPTGVRIDLPTDKIISLYEGGSSENALADKFGVSRNVIRRHLVENGIHIRTQSEAEALKWSQMSEEERKAQVEAAHEAATGREHTFEELCKRAKTRERNASEDYGHVSDYEVELRSMLSDRGINTTIQKAIGPYNCDLAASPVAVEVYGGHWHWTGDHLARVDKRFRYILNRGWFIYVIPVTKSYPLTGAVADHVVSYINRIRRNEPSVCEYRVVWGAGKFVTAGSAEDDNISIVPPFTNARDISSGCYKSVSR